MKTQLFHVEAKESHEKLLKDKTQEPATPAKGVHLF